MNHRLLTMLFITLCLTFAGMSLVSGQEKEAEGAGQEDAEGDTGEEKDQEGKDDEKAEDEPEVMSDDAFHDFMEDTINHNWKRLKIDHRKKMADRAATAAENMKKAAPKILQYDGEVLRGNKKGEKARDQKDFQRWVKQFESDLEDYATQVRKGNWDKGDELKDKLNDVCADCHDAYEPPPGE